MRKTVVKKLWKIASSMEQKSSMTKDPDGAIRWEGFARLYKNMKKAYRKGK